MAADGGEIQVLVRFVTKLPPELRVPETPVAVPASLRRYGLSQIVNHLLALDPARPFDFLVNGELVRKSLEQHLLDHNLSAESLLEVEYVPAVVPPKPTLSTPHDDWVSAVDVAPDGAVVTGSYDGVVRIWDVDLSCVASASAHAGGVNAAAALPARQGHGLIVTAGKDATAKLWRREDGAATGSSSVRLLATYHGHRDAVEAVAPSPDGSQLATCGWDGAVLLWRTGKQLADQADEAAAAAAAAAGAGADADGAGAADGKHKKKRKVKGEEGTAVAVAVPEALDVRQPAAVLQGHLHCVAAAAWPSATALYTAGWDHSVRRWDAETCANTDTYNGSKAVLAVACTAHGATGSSGGGHVVAFAGSDRAVRLWDCRGRTRGEELGVRALGSHAGWVASLAWCPGSEHRLASSSYDGSVRVWDTRAGGVPLASLPDCHDGHKVLCVAWERDSGALLSGGADCRLRRFEFDSKVGGLIAGKAAAGR